MKKEAGLKPEDCVCVEGLYASYKDPREVYLVGRDSAFDDYKSMQGLFIPFNFCPFCGKELENADSS